MQTHNARGTYTAQKIAGALLAVLLAAALAACSGGSGKTAGAGEKAGQETTSQASDAAATKDGDLVIPIAEITEDPAFYPVEVDGTEMEIIAVKAPDGTIRTAFNTCQVCYDSGRGYYKQSGDKLVCQNCGNQFGMGDVEVKAGGCNPWPIFDEDKSVTDESITISYDFLKESKEIFANWKQTY